MSKQKTAWKSRIIGEGEVTPDDLLAHPQNWRIHPQNQHDALSAVLNRIGWVQRVVVNKRTGHIVDGHLRVELAVQRKEKTVPVIYVDLDEEEENAILATLDPIGAMATTNNKLYDDLLASIEIEDGAIQKLLDDMKAATEAAAQAPPPEDFDAFDENIETEYCCPKCGYTWSGSPS